MNLSELKQKPIAELIEMTASMGLDNLARSRKQDIIFALLKKHAKSGEDIYGDGVLEILPDGFGFCFNSDRFIGRVISRCYRFKKVWQNAICKRLGRLYAA